MSESIILPLSLLATLPLAYLILRLIFGKSVMVTLGWWVAILVFLCCEMFYVVGKFGISHLFWALPVMFIVGTSIFVFLDLSIRRPMLRAIDGIVEISNGNLSNNYHEKNTPKVEIGLLYDSVKSLRSNLINIVTDVQENSDGVYEISQQLSEKSSGLAQGSALQASSIQEVSATLEEFAMSIQESTSNAQQTEKVTTKAYERMAFVAAQTIKNVESNRLIANKIKVINEIAVRTNILALNATVEAARAGDAGRGFAVVAGEVRKLAELSKRAADEIVSLAQNTYVLAESTGKIIDETLPAISDASLVIKEISAVGVEQQRGADEINNAMHQLDKVAQDNVLSSEILSSSADELAKRADVLKEKISFFNLTAQ